MIVLEYEDISIKNKKMIHKGALLLPSNGVFLLQGANGCGKTLLLKNIHSNVRNSSYKIVFMDQNNTLLLNSQDVLHNIAMTDDEHRLEEVKEAIQRLGYGYLLSRRVSRMSGGECRTVNMLRCVLSDADILLIDEPTNDLDYDMVNRMVKLFENVGIRKMLLIITHDDRLCDIADGIFRVTDNEVKEMGLATSGKNNILQEAEDEVSVPTFSTVVTERFVSRSFTNDYVSVLLVILFTFFLGIQALSFYDTVKEDVPQMTEGQILFTNMYSVWRDAEDEKGLPSFAISSMTSINIIKQIEVVKDVVEFWNRPYAELYDISLASTDKYTVYPLEYLNPETGEVVWIIDYFLMEYHGTSLGESGVVAEALFQLPSTIAREGSVILDEDTYWECVGELCKNEEYIVSAVYVVLQEGVQEEAFWELNEIQKLCGHECMVSSNEVFEYQHQLDELSKLVSSLKTILIMGLVALVCACSAIRIRLQLNKTSVIVFRNYSISKELVAEAMKKRINNRVRLLTIAIGYSVWNVWIYCDLTFSQINFVFSFIMMFYVAIMYRLYQWFIERYVRKYYRWWER